MEGMKLNFKIEEVTLSKGTKCERVARCAIIYGHEDRPREIFTAKEGFEYFKILNPYVSITKESSKESSLEQKLSLLFHNRLTDAIQAVRDGYAHCIMGKAIKLNVFEKDIAPIYILDEEAGKRYRERLIKDFENAEFGWSIQLGNCNSLGGAKFVNEDGYIISPFDNINNRCFYKTEAEANAVIALYTSKAKELAYKAAENNDNFDKFIGDINYYHLNIVGAFACEYVDLKDDDVIVLKEDADSLKKWYCDVVQAIRFTSE